MFQLFIKQALDIILRNWEMSVAALSVRFVAFFIYYMWILFVYILSLLVTTFYTQDIFDEVGGKRLREYFLTERDPKKKEKVENMMKNLKIKEMSFDMV